MPNASDEPPTATAEQLLPPGYPWPRPRSRVLVKPDLLPAAAILVLVAVLGLAVGWLWSRLAPPQQVRVLPDRQVPLPIESYHRFDDLGIFVFLCLGAGLCTGLGVWLLRERRGPVLLVAAVLGSLAAAWLAAKVGLALAHARYPQPQAPKLGDVVAKAPVLESWWAIVAWPLTAALVYGVMSAWNGLDDLGRRPVWPVSSG
ncbi:MAG: DUF2567 domain-containing protein [Labedaea sp.]